jgi:hypothetical protein
VASSAALPDLMRRLDRKLDIGRGLHLSYDDLAVLVATGAYAKLQEANREHLERQCREHVARTRSISGVTSPSIPGQGGTSKSSGMPEMKWWAWQGLNLRPLRCQGRDTSAFPLKTAVFCVPLVRTRRERSGNRAPVYRKFTALHPPPACCHGVRGVSYGGER